MNVLAVNGSARKDGNTKLLLEAAMSPLEEAGIACELVQLGGQKVQGCTACGQCYKKQDGMCHGRKDYGNEVFRLSDEFQEQAIKEGVKRMQQFAAEDPLFKKVFDHQAAFFKVWHSVTEEVTPEICMYDYVE